MGINPTVFGPYVWAAIHLICLGAPKVLDDTAKAQYKAFFTQLPAVLPCKGCGRHLEENLKKLPIDLALNTSGELFAWSVQLHNLVNSQLNKPQLDEKEALSFWSSAPKCVITASSGKSSFTFDPMSIIYFIIILLIGIVLGFFLKSSKYFRKY
jgi:hypothetical protein